jgi:hypothetical protein
VTGNVTGTAATVTGAAQAAITSLGSLTALSVNGTASVGTLAAQTGGISSEPTGGAYGVSVTSTSSQMRLRYNATAPLSASFAVSVGGNLSIQPLSWDTQNLLLGYRVAIADDSGSLAATDTALLSIPAATTAVSSLRIAHGTAPSAPVDGDIWTTTAGLFVRINGATVGPLS